MYLGLSDRADEVYIGLSDGSVARARTLRRREAAARHDFPFLQRLTARPWDPPRSGGPGDGELGPRPLVVVPPMGAGWRTAWTPESVHHSSGPGPPWVHSGLPRMRGSPV